MPYYGDGSPYAGYYTGTGSTSSSSSSSFANHSSLMTGVNRYFNPIAARYSPHLSTISETPSLMHLRRHHQSTSLTSLPRARRIIDTADIDVSTPPRSHTQDNHQQRHRLRRDRPTIKIRSQALKDNPALREYNEKHEKTVGELLVEKFLIKDKSAPERKIRLYHQPGLLRSNDDVMSKEKENEILAAIARRVTRRMTRRRSSADIVPLDPEQIKREAALQAAQAEVLDTLVAEEQAEIECEVRRGTFVKRPAMRLQPEVSESEDDGEGERKVHATAKKKKRKKSLDKPPPLAVESDEEDDDDIIEIAESIIEEEEEEEDFEWDDRKKCDDIRKVLPEKEGQTIKSDTSDNVLPKKFDDKLRTVVSEPIKSEIEERLDQMNAKIKNLKKEMKETDRREIDKKILKKAESDAKLKDDERRSKSSLKRTKSAPIEPSGYKIEACNSVGDFSTLFVKASNVTEQFRESIRLPAPPVSTEVVVVRRKPYVRDTSRNSVYLALKPGQKIRSIDDTRKEDDDDKSRPAKCDDRDRSIIENDVSCKRSTTALTGGDEFVSWWDESPAQKSEVISVVEQDKVIKDVVKTKLDSNLTENIDLDDTKSKVVVEGLTERKDKVDDKVLPANDLKTESQDLSKIPVNDKVEEVTVEEKATIKITKKSDGNLQNRIILDNSKDIEDKVENSSVSEKLKIKVPSKTKSDKDIKTKASDLQDKPKDKVEVPLKKKIEKETVTLSDLENKLKLLTESSNEKKLKTEAAEKSKSKPEILPKPKLEKKVTDLQDKSKIIGDSPKEEKDKIEKTAVSQGETVTISDLENKLKLLTESSKESKLKTEAAEKLKSKPEILPKPKLEKKVTDLPEKSKTIVDLPKQEKGKLEKTPVSEKAENKIKILSKEKLENKTSVEVKELTEEKSKEVTESLNKNVKSLIIDIKDKSIDKIADIKSKVSEKRTEKAASVTKDLPEKVPEVILESKEKATSNILDTKKEKEAEKLTEIGEKFISKSVDTKEKATVVKEKVADKKETIVLKTKEIKEKVIDAKDKSTTKTDEIKAKVPEKILDKKEKISKPLDEKDIKVDKIRDYKVTEKTIDKVITTDDTREKVPEKPVEIQEKVDRKLPHKNETVTDKVIDIKEKSVEEVTEIKEKITNKQTETISNEVIDLKTTEKLVDTKPKVPEKLEQVEEKITSQQTETKAIDETKIIESKQKEEKIEKEPKSEARPGSPQKKTLKAPEELREKSTSPTNEKKRKFGDKKSSPQHDLIKPEVRHNRRHLPLIPEEQQPCQSSDNKSAAEPSLAPPRKETADRRRKVDSEAVMKIEKKILEDAESPDKILTSALPQKEAPDANITLAAPTEIDFWNEIETDKVQSRKDPEEDRKSSLKLDFDTRTPQEEEDEEKTPIISQPATPLVENLSEVPLANLQQRSSSVFQDDEVERSATVKKISKWTNHDNLSNLNDIEAEVTPVGSKDASPQASTVTKKKIVKKKKSTVTKKKASEKGDSSKSSTGTKKTKKTTGASPQTSLLKTPMSAFGSPRNTPAQRPPELNKLFYTTPAILLTATPRDLQKVRRAKVKRKKPPTRTPSLSSDSTGSTRSTATTTSTEEGSNCEEDAEHKRLASTRSNDSGFDGSPRLSNCDMVCHKKCEKLTGNLCGLNQKLVAEALQALKQKGPVYKRHGRKSFVRRRLRPYLNYYGYVDPMADLASISFETPSQSSENQKNPDSDHFHHSGRITPPATNLPRFKKYEVTDFNFLKVLGKGSFGKVLLAELRGTESVYAVKCLKKDVVLEDDDVECTLIERKVLTLATRHPYLCHLFCTFQTESHLFFVMEYLNGGDLMFHIQKSGRFSEARAKFYAAEIWSGLIFLHKKGIVYRDLKLDNVLLDFEGHIRIADFGMCKLQIFLDRTADTFCGTPDYMAPEIIKGLKYNQAVDWWSFGVLLYEMLTGQSPFSGCDEDELFWSICNERPFIPRYLSQSSTDILVCLLEKDAGKRIPGHEIACHPFFCTISWEKLERRVLEPPFKPAVEHTLDTRYFDTAFTTERPRLTPVPEQILTSMDQAVFRGFSYTNPNATD